MSHVLCWRDCRGEVTDWTGQSLEDRQGEKKRARERENKIKVKFNIWFVIFIVKRRRLHGKHKERQFKQYASYVVINHTESAILRSNPSS